MVCTVPVVTYSRGPISSSRALFRRDKREEGGCTRSTWGSVNADVERSTTRGNQVINGTNERASMSCFFSPRPPPPSSLFDLSIHHR